MASVKLVLKDVIGSYVYVREPKINDDGKEKYSIQIIIDKDDPQVNLIREAVISVAKSTFGEKVKLGALKMPVRDGDTERDGKEYEHKFFLNANSSRAPQIVNRFGKIATEQDLDEYCYSGATFHVSVNIYGFDFGGKKGIAVGLNNIMLRKKTDRLDGATSAVNEFAQFADKSEVADTPETAADDFGLDEDVPF